MNNYKVYMHECPNGKKYIGITQQELNTRWNYGNGYKSCVLFNRAIQKYGWSNIKHTVLFEELSKEEAEQKEIELISKYKTNEANYGYNICSGGKGTPNHLVSEELRDKISIKTKEAMNKKEIREKIRKCHLGKKLSEEHKKKIKLSARTFLTESEKEKLREINKSKIKVKCIETQTIYESIHEAWRMTGISYQNIYKVCKGERKRAGGYSWQYEY